MKREVWPKIGLIFILSITLLIGASLKARADEVKDMYDDLDRLYQLIDPQGEEQYWKEHRAVRIVEFEYLVLQMVALALSTNHQILVGRGTPLFRQSL